MCLYCCAHLCLFSFFFHFKYPSPTQIYTLSLHDALPISHQYHMPSMNGVNPRQIVRLVYSLILKSSHPYKYRRSSDKDRKSTRLNSSHVAISYAVFCLKKKKILSTRRTHRTMILAERLYT